MTESRTARFRGRALPDRPDWEISTIARRTTNRDATETCVATGAEIPLDGVHYLVTIRTPGKGWTDYEYDEFVVSDGALGELDVWLENDEE